MQTHKNSVHLYTDSSFRISSAFDWTLRDPSDQEIKSGSQSMGPFYKAFDVEVSRIENGISALLRCRYLFNNLTVHVDSMALIGWVEPNKRRLIWSWAVKLIFDIQYLWNKGKGVLNRWINGHNINTGTDCTDARTFYTAENTSQTTVKS
jgi:hypothetical protein